TTVLVTTTPEKRPETGQDHMQPAITSNTAEPAALVPPASSAPRERHVSSYAELSQLIRAAGLLRRRYGYYWTLMLTTVAAFAGIWVGFVLLGDSWYQLLLAAALAVVLAQFGFIGHEGAHRQFFASHRWNEWTARCISVLSTGLRYGCWSREHNRHHAKPNMSGTDTDRGQG